MKITLVMGLQSSSIQNFLSSSSVSSYFSSLEHMSRSKKLKIMCSLFDCYLMCMTDIKYIITNFYNGIIGIKEKFLKKIILNRKFEACYSWTFRTYESIYKFLDRDRNNGLLQLFQWLLISLTGHVNYR